MEQELFLPTLSSMQYGNVWTGSLGSTRWRIVPAEGEMTAELWYGPLCYELSEIAHTARFPIGEEGIEQLRAWLLEHTQR